MRLEFSTTAMRRPDILEATYKSFTNQLQGVDWGNSTLYLNVDPLPEDGDPQKCIEIAEKYFGKVVFRLPEKPHFTAAVKWCWSQVEGPFLFHLEDDWVLKIPIHIQDMVNRMNKFSKAVQVALKAHHAAYGPKICLSPSLLKGDFVRRMSELFTLKCNPEIQLRGSNLCGGCTCVFPPKSKIILKDLGRRWLAQSDYKRPPRKGKFVQWIKK